GHGRYESIAGRVVSCIILEVGITCFKDSFGRILHPVETSMSTLQFIVLAALILVKVWMGVENGILGKKIDSPSLKATSADSFSDVLTSGATITALLIGKLTGFNIDGYMGVVVSVLILIAGVKIIKETLEPLIGTAASYEDYKRITEFVESYDGIYGTHDLIVHNYGPAKLIATIHAEVDDSEDMVVAHELVDKIERDAGAKLGILLTIHMDPVAVNDERLKELKPLITKIVQKYEVKGSIHDLRMVKGNENINLIFDITLPHKHIYMEDELSQLVSKEVKKIDPRFNCVIEVEHGFVNDMDS
ncbi:MAG: cation diffusion facilitator family transporter, partial [Lachnospiraceae bacterium]|nr:cation diffusion facilitator family transporter [Lachnospiraceae bacterium]